MGWTKSDMYLFTDDAKLDGSVSCEEDAEEVSEGYKLNE